MFQIFLIPHRPIFQTYLPKVSLKQLCAMCCCPFCFYLVWGFLMVQFHQLAAAITLTMRKRLFYTSDNILLLF